MARKTKQQAQETRQQILDAAIQEFSVRGVSNTSLNGIATAAGVTRGAIYWHFKNKVELFNEVWQKTESKIDDLEKQYQAKFPNDPLRVMREIMICVLTSTASDPRRRALMEILFHKCEFLGEMATLKEARKELYHATNGRIEASLIVCMKHEQLPATLDPIRSAIVMRAYLTGLMENWLFMPETFDLKEEANTMVDIFIDMLRLSPHLQISTT